MSTCQQIDLIDEIATLRADLERAREALVSAADVLCEVGEDEEAECARLTAESLSTRGGSK